jgi:hypothetical protein
MIETKKYKKYSNFKPYLVLFLLLKLLNACQNTTEKCKFGAPKAIFSDTMKAVKKHHFELKEQTGIEMVAFENGMLLELEQSGCNDIHQQFTFFMPGDFSKAEDNVWKLLAIKNFQMLSSYSPSLLSFRDWASAIDNVKDKMKLAEPIEVEKNTHVRIDKIVSPDKAMLVIQLSQVP